MKNGEEIREFAREKQNGGYKTTWSIWEAFCKEVEYCNYKTFRKHLNEEKNGVFLNPNKNTLTIRAFKQYNGRFNGMGICQIYAFYKRLGGKAKETRFYKDIEKLSRDKTNKSLLCNVGKAYYWCNTLRVMLGEEELPKVEWVECIPPSVKQSYLMEFLELLREDFNEVAEKFFKEERSLLQKREDDMMLYWLAHCDDKGKSKKKNFLLDKFCDEMSFYMGLTKFEDNIFNEDFSITKIQKYSYNNKISYDTFVKNTRVKKWFQKGFQVEFLSRIE